MNYIDLHIHSTYSDGTYTPEEILKLASEKNLKAIALTDHDTLNGVYEAEKEAEKYGVEFIAGCEISATFNNTKIHVLGYFPEGITSEMISILEERRKRRHLRIKKICEQLQAAGIDICYEEVVDDVEKDSPGRANVAEKMFAKGYVKSVADAFSGFLVKGKVGYVESVRITPKEAVEIIKRNNGMAYIAHLNQIKEDNETIFSLLCELKKYGLDGIEGYYTQYDDEQNELYRGFAKKLDLLLSGGSDFHGDIKPEVQLGVGYGNLKVPYELYENMIKNVNK